MVQIKPWSSDCSLACDLLLVCVCGCWVVCVLLLFSQLMYSPWHECTAIGEHTLSTQHLLHTVSKVLSNREGKRGQMGEMRVEKCISCVLEWDERIGDS